MKFIRHILSVPITSIWHNHDSARLNNLPVCHTVHKIALDRIVKCLRSQKYATVTTIPSKDSSSNCTWHSPTS
jgi:hypothetical protein